MNAGDAPKILAIGGSIRATGKRDDVVRETAREAADLPDLIARIFGASPAFISGLLGASFDLGRGANDRRSFAHGS